MRIFIKSSQVFKSLNKSRFISARRSLSSFDTEYKLSITKPEEFWGPKADLIEWFKYPTKIFDPNVSPYQKWYCDGELNASYNCLDVHVNSGFGDQTAIIHDSPLTETIKNISYKELLEEVALFAGVLSKQGVKKGDVVLIYMPMIPQAVVAMLATARLGAIHSLVFGGFASKELSTRVSHAKPKVIVSANAGVEPHRVINYKDLLDKAIELSDHKPKKCIYFNRPMFPEIDLKINRDMCLNYEKELSMAKKHDCVAVDSNHPLYLLYTSGTTGTPKAVVRITAGYLIALKWSMNAVYGCKPGETWFAGSDLGWTVGHSYTAYGPLLSRNTSVLYEGKPVGTPDASAYFRVISQHKVVSGFMAPTALRAIRQQDPKAELGSEYPTDSLRHLFVAGEHCDMETMHWAKKTFKKPIFDHWWQTETGWPISSMCAGLMTSDELKSVPDGVSGKPVPGYDIKVLRDDLTEANPNELGRVVIKLPFPPGTISTLWKNDKLFEDLYFKTYPGYYDTCDVGYKCENGFITVSARADDVINVAGHRLSSSGIEEAILNHSEVSECAVVELKDEIKGAIPFAYIVRNKDSKESEKELIQNAVANVRKEIGPVAAFKKAVVVPRLPKTRSGKIPRATLKNMINNKPFMIPTTIDDPTVYDDIRKALLNHNFDCGPVLE